MSCRKKIVIHDNPLEEATLTLYRTTVLISKKSHQYEKKKANQWRNASQQAAGTMNPGVTFMGRRANADEHFDL